MRKNELLHCHALLVALAREFDEQGVLDGGELDAYRELGVRPTSVRAPRADHEEAVLELAAALAAAADAPAPAART